jgi:hypothetical protein
MLKHLPWTHHTVMYPEPSSPTKIWCALQLGEWAKPPRPPFSVSLFSGPSLVVSKALIVHYFTFFVPIAQQARQAVMPRRLSLNMCLWNY